MLLALPVARQRWFPDCILIILSKCGSPGHTEHCNEV